MILLDTHAWVWWLNDDGGLSDKARETIRSAEADGGIAVSTISTWELALLVARGRVQLSIPVGEWVSASEAIPGLTFLAPDNAVMVESVALPGEFHADPADRIIVASARLTRRKVVTKDRRMHDYPHVEAIW